MVNIIEVAYKWNGILSLRNKTEAVVLHHAAARATVADIHSWHLARDWAGIGYHYYIRRNGTIYRGRPEATIGAHAGSNSGYNGKSIGICFEGNFEVDFMPPPQLEAGRELLKDIFARYGKLGVLKHKDLTATACPGRNFPFEDMLRKDDDMEQVKVKVGSQAINGYLIDGQTYVPLRAFWDAVETAINVTWDAKEGTASLGME